MSTSIHLSSFGFLILSAAPFVARHTHRRSGATSMMTMTRKRRLMTKRCGISNAQTLCVSTRSFIAHLLILGYTRRWHVAIKTTEQYYFIGHQFDSHWNLNTSRLSFDSLILSQSVVDTNWMAWCLAVSQKIEEHPHWPFICICNFGAETERQ